MKEEILYKRTNDRKITIFLKAVDGKRGYPEYIKKYDRLILIGIKRDGMELTTAYSYPDQVEMWKRVFEVQVKPERKMEIINILANLLDELKERL